MKRENDTNWLNEFDSWDERTPFAFFVGSVTIAFCPSKRHHQPVNINLFANFTVWLTCFAGLESVALFTLKNNSISKPAKQWNFPLQRQWVFCAPASQRLRLLFNKVNKHFTKQLNKSIWLQVSGFKEASRWAQKAPIRLKVRKCCGTKPHEELEVEYYGEHVDEDHYFEADDVRNWKAASPEVVEESKQT